MLPELAARVFQARNIAHLEHWQTRSYGAHVALGSFYDKVIDAIDAVVENSIGMYGPIDRFTVEDKPVGDIVAYLQEEADWIESNREEICGGSSSIGNLVDNLVSVYTQTVFLLRLK